MMCNYTASFAKCKEICKKVDLLTSSSLSKYGISDFMCCRVYENGQIIPLTSIPEFLVDYIFPHKFVMKSPHPKLFCPFSHSFSYLWEEAYDKETLKYFQNRYKLFHGLTFIFRYPEYCDRVNFAIEEEIPFPGSFYFSIFEELKNFYKFFLQEASDLFQCMEAFKIIYPIEKLDHHLSHHLINKQHNYKLTIGNDQNTYVTFIELFCLHMIGLGESEEKIGQILRISPQSVSDYIYQAKKRTGMSREKLILQTYSNDHNNEYFESFYKSFN